MSRHEPDCVWHKDSGQCNCPAMLDTAPGGEDLDDDGLCCTLNEPYGHPGPCVRVCSDCNGTGLCWACGGPSGDDLGTGCSACDGDGYCSCDEGTVVDDV